MITGSSFLCTHSRIHPPTHKSPRWVFHVNIFYIKHKEECIIRYPNTNTEKCVEKTRSSQIFNHLCYAYSKTKVFAIDIILWNTLSSVWLTCQSIYNSLRSSTQKLTKFYDNQDHITEPPSL